MKDQEQNFEAQIEYFSDVERAKLDGVGPEYSPHHKFQHWDNLLTGWHYTDNNELLYAGSTYKVRIRLASWQYLDDQIQIGDEFTIQEINHVVGKGVVTRLL